MDDALTELLIWGFIEVMLVVVFCTRIRSFNFNDPLSPPQRTSGPVPPSSVMMAHGDTQYTSSADTELTLGGGYGTVELRRSMTSAGVSRSAGRRAPRA